MASPFLPSRIPPAILVPERSPYPDNLPWSGCGEEYQYEYSVTQFPIEAAVNPPPVLTRLISADLISLLVFILYFDFYIYNENPSVSDQGGIVATRPPGQTLPLHNPMPSVCPTWSLRSNCFAQLRICTTCGDSHDVFYRGCPTCKLLRTGKARRLGFIRTLIPYSSAALHSDSPLPLTMFLHLPQYLFLIPVKFCCHSKSRLPSLHHYSKNSSLHFPGTYLSYALLN